MNPINGVFSVMLSTVPVLACYIFHTYQPILIMFFVDSKVVVLSTVHKYYFSLCNTSLSTRLMLSAVQGRPTASSVAIRTTVDLPSNPQLLQQHW